MNIVEHACLSKKKAKECYVKKQKKNAYQESKAIKFISSMNIYLYKVC